MIHPARCLRQVATGGRDGGHGERSFVCFFWSEGPEEVLLKIDVPPTTKYISLALLMIQCHIEFAVFDEVLFF